MRDHKEGKRTEPFFEKNEYNQNVMRIAKQTPKDVAQVAYWHTPEINAENGVSFINKGHIDQNIIDSSIKESLMIADDSGVLNYVDIKGKDDYQIKSPANRVPSNDIAMTNKFYGEFPDIKNALYYRVEIMYHYESTAYGSDEDFLIREYEGSEIAIVDLLGRSMEDKVVHKVYTQAIKGYHFLRKITVLLGDVDREETVCIRYNHVSSLAQKHEMVAVKNKVELYNSSKNKLTVQGKSKEMMESGLIRIINLRSFMKEVEKNNLNGNEEFAVEEFTDGKGYVLSVNAKTERDPREGEFFSYIIEANYKDKFGFNVKRSTGLLYEHVYNKEDILPNEKSRYRGNGKTIGMIEGMTTLDARAMLHKSLPLGTVTIPDEAEIVVKDGNGNILYYENNVDGNNNIDTYLDGTGYIVSENKKSKGKWEQGIKPNNLLDEIPHNHRFTLIAEHQPNQWSFAYKIRGEGKIPYKIKKDFKWRVRAHFGISSSNKSQAVHINDPSTWQAFGEADPLREEAAKFIMCLCGKTLYEHDPRGGGSTPGGPISFIPISPVPSEEYIETPQNTKDLWRLGENGPNGTSSLSYDGNHEDLIGFYNKYDQNGRNLINDLTDYEFSTIVEITDREDDDAIGVIFRVKDDRNYYMFLWEKHERNLAQSNGLGVGRIFLGTEGYTHYKYSATIRDYRFTDDIRHYDKRMGYGENHKVLLRAQPSNKPIHSGQSTTPGGYTIYPNYRIGVERYPVDKTNTEFTDITLKDGVSVEEIGKKGWEINKKYKITVQVSGNYFAVYINEGGLSEGKGEKVLEGIDEDNVHTHGTYGIAVLSQKDVSWSDLRLSEYDTDYVDSPVYETTLSSQNKKLLIEKKVDVLMHPFVENLFIQGGKYEGKTYNIISYEGVPLDNMDVEVHQNSRNIYGRPLNPTVGKEGLIDWNTDESEPALSIVGTGTVTFRDDGSNVILTDHKMIPDVTIPSNIKNFKWNNPIITSGSNIEVYRKGKALYFNATQPEIKEIGRVWRVDEQLITTKEGVKTLVTLTDKDIYKIFNIDESIPLNEIALRIEKGHILQNSNRSEYPSPEMNYRFRVKREEVYKLVVDQNKGHEGVNRLRLSQVYRNNSKFIDQELDVDVVGWLTKPTYRTVPVYAVKIRNDYHIMAHPPRIDGSTDNIDAWLPTITKGKLLKRIVLPEVVDDGKDQIVYERYPELKQFASTPDKQEEVEAVYSIPEYNRMHFVNQNIQQADKEVPRFITDRILQVKNFNIITDHNEKTPNNRVTAIKSNKRVEIGIKDIDSEKGIFFLHEPLDEENEPLVSYSYEEKDYIYPGFVNGNLDTEPKLEIDPKPYPIKGVSTAKLKVTARNEYPTSPPWFVMLSPSSNLINIKEVGDFVIVRIQLRDQHNLEGYQIKLNGVVVDEKNNLPFNTTSYDAREIKIPVNKTGNTYGAGTDIIFLFDVTGSMSNYLDKIRRETYRFFSMLEEKGLDWRGAVVMYGDGGSGEYTNNRPYRTRAEDIIEDITEITSKTTYLSNLTGTLYPPRHQREWGRWVGAGNYGENTFEALLDKEYGAASYEKKEGVNRHIIIVSDEAILTKEFIELIRVNKDFTGSASAEYTLQEGLDLVAQTNDFYHLITNLDGYRGYGFGAMHDDVRINTTHESIDEANYDFVKIKDKIVESIKDQYNTIEIDVQNKAGISHSDKIIIKIEDMG